MVVSVSHSAAAVAAAAAAAAAARVPAGGCVCQSGLSRARRLPWSMGRRLRHPAGSRSGRQTPSAVSVREKVSQGQQMMGPSGGSSQTAPVGRWKRPGHRGGEGWTGVVLSAGTRHESRFAPTALPTGRRRPLARASRLRRRR